MGLADMHQYSTLNAKMYLDIVENISTFGTWIWPMGSDCEQSCLNGTATTILMGITKKNTVDCLLKEILGIVFWMNTAFRSLQFN